MVKKKKKKSNTIIFNISSLNISKWTIWILQVLQNYKASNLLTSEVMVETLGFFCIKSNTGNVLFNDILNEKQLNGFARWDWSKDPPQNDQMFYHWATSCSLESVDAKTGVFLKPVNVW